jgi:cyclic pyranopterin phosphate synthase
MMDAYNREMTYLRVSVTDRCNLRCQYCIPEDGVEKVTHEDILTLEEIDTLISHFVALGITKVRITGGEPLVRKGIISLIQKISRHKEIVDLALTTNGILLKDMAKDLKEAGLLRVNISLDTLNPDKYREMTRGGNLEEVLEGIEAAKKAGLGPIKLNVVLIKNYNDDEVQQFVQWTRTEDLEIRFIELMPIGQVAEWSVNHYISNDEVLRQNPELVKMTQLDIKSPAVMYQMPGAIGKVGLISPISCKFCSNCNRMRLTSEGQLIDCLHSNKGYDLRTLLRNKGDVKATIIEAMVHKSKEHTLEGGDFTKTNMVRMGG